jgi:FMN phosphatase YigB (HAD superfamily)
VNPAQTSASTDSTADATAGATAAALHASHDQARALFAGLDTLLPAPQPPALEPLLDAVSTHWDQVDIVSFDVFDTALLRRVQGPRDVFLFLHDRPPFTALKRSSHDVAVLRMFAEDQARREGFAQRGSAEVTLTEIYTSLATATGLPQALVPQMVEAERDVERAVCVTHPVLHALYRRAKADGKTVWFVSDTYHEPEFLRELLVQTGYDASDRVVASCEHRASKGEGSLFARALGAVPPGRVLHIGDNAHSDGTRAAAAGLRAVVHPFPTCGPAAEMAPSPAHAAVRGIAAVATKARQPAPEFWWAFGYRAAGPLLTGFATWLADAFTRDGVDRAYFLLRDGEILLRIFDIVAGHRPGMPQRSLLHSSRRAFVLPALETFHPSIVSQLFVATTDRPVRQFLTRFDIPVEGLESAFRAVGFSGPDHLIRAGDVESLTMLAALFRHPAVKERILQYSRAERELLVEYLAQEGLYDASRVALVDVGWNGTIQKALRKVHRLAGRPLTDVGYYIGTDQPIRAADEPEMVSHGYLFDSAQPRESYLRSFAFRELFEFICSSTRGGLRRFERTGTRVVPIEEPADADASQHAALRAVHEGAVAFAVDFRDAQPRLGLGALSSDVAAHEIWRLINSPTTDEAARVGDLTYGEGMGSAVTNAMARFRDGTATALSVLEDYDRAYWKAGMLARRDPRTLLLRNAMWMAGM